MLALGRKHKPSAVLVVLAAVELVLALAPTSAHAQESRARRIDGSSPARFEASVAALQKEIPTRRREEFEIALTVIWMTRASGGLDYNGDGNVDTFDIRQMTDDAGDLLAAARRGDLLSAIEKRRPIQGKVTTTDYIKQLDGLGYEEVIGLAGVSSPAHLSADLRRSRVDMTPTIDAATGKLLNEAIQARQAQKYAEARSKIGTLNVRRLSPYERSKTEQILFEISYAEGSYNEAREHLENAIAAGGLNPMEVQTSLTQIRFIESSLVLKPLPPNPLSP